MKEFLQKLSVAMARRTYFIHRPSFKKLGKRSVIYKPIMIRGRKYISLGNYCFFFKGARVEAISKYGGNQRFNPDLKIGDNTTFEQNCHLTCAGKMTIGKNCTFSANIYISDSEHSNTDRSVSVLEQDLKVSEVSIGDNCFIGIGSFILAGTKLGNGVIVGANSVVKGVFPDNVMLVGSPARIIKRFDAALNEWVPANSEKLNEL